MVSPLPNDWDSVKLESLTTIKYGKGLPTKKLTQEGFPVFGANGVIGKYTEYLYEEEQVLISCRGAYSGKINLSPKQCYVTNNSLVLELPNEPKVAKKYLYYALEAANKSKIVTGSAQPQVTINNAKELIVPVAPRDQQDRIVAEIEKQFSRLDEAVASLKRVKANLKRYKAAVLKAAVEGKLTEDLPSRQAGWRDSEFRNVSGKLVPTEKTEEKYYTYVLECTNGSLYKGMTKNLFARIDMHLAGQGSKWTKENKPVSIVHFEEFDTQKEAVEREKYLKSGSGREWLEQIRERNNKKYEPASKLLERILAERRAKWEEAELTKMKTKGKEPKNDKWKEKYKEPATLRSLEVPSGWVSCSSDEIFAFVTSGSRGWAKYYSDEGPMFLRMGNLDHDTIDLDLAEIQHVQPPENGEGTRTRVQANDLLISITADVGMLGLVPDGLGEAYINQHVALARPVVSVNAHYIAWYFVSWAAKNQLKALQKGATKVGLGLDDIRGIAIALPSIEEQEELVASVDAALSRIGSIEATVLQQEQRIAASRSAILKQAFSGPLAYRDGVLKEM